MISRLAGGIAAFCLATTAQAADPTVDSLTPGIWFAAYSSPTPVGLGEVDSNTLFLIDELTGPLGNSWYVFYDPADARNIFANITFDAPITCVFSTRADLDGSNATYGAPGINYGTSFFIGLEDRTEPVAPRLAALRAQVPEGAATVLLAHHPDVFDHALAAGIPLTLAGHTHGGQIAVPGLPHLNVARLLISRFDRGTFTRAGSHLHVSRGVGTSGQPVRVGCPAEITTLSLVAPTP